MNLIAIYDGILTINVNAPTGYAHQSTDAITCYYVFVAEGENPPISNDAIPDVKLTDRYAARICAFYRAGILVGSDAQGTFNPESNIACSEVAAIITRMLDAAARRPITLN